MDQLNIMQALENSPKGRLSYNTGWDESPNAITNLITAVQELEVDKPKRKIVENAFRVVHMKERFSLSPKTSPNSASTTRSRNRHSLPANVIEATKKQEQPDMSKSLLSSLQRLTKMEKIQRYSSSSQSSPPRTNNSYPPQPEFRIEEVSSNSSNWSIVESDCVDTPNELIMKDKRRLIPPAAIRRKKSAGGSPRFKPSPYSSSTHTQTHSSTTSASEATNTTPTRQPTGKYKMKYGILEEDAPYHEKIEEDILLESKASPYDYIALCNSKYQTELEEKFKDATHRRVLQFEEQEREMERKAAETEAIVLKSKREQDEALKKKWSETERANLYAVQMRQKDRLQQDEKIRLERKAALDASERSRQATEEAARQEQQKIQKLHEEELRRKEESDRLKLEQQRAEAQKAAEEKRKAENDAALAAQKLEEQKKAPQVVPELNGLILREDLTVYTKTTDLLKQYEDAVVHVDGQSAATKAFYVGAVKCINTPLNALGCTDEQGIASKIQHLSKLLSGEAVSGGGSLTTSFSCTSIPQGDLFVMKTFAFRFVKKAEADVTRGTSTVQPLATVGVHLCKQFPAWAALVQAYLYKLCPFLVPFSFPQGPQSIQEYAKSLGHELTGPETVIQQTLLERLKGYCTLYALMILRFHKEGSFDIGEITDFFTIGGAWKILVKTIKLEPQIDVTATIIHTLLDILDDTLYATYKAQFTKLIRLLITYYLPKIKTVTPPAKSGSISRLQTYIEKKYSA